MFDIIKDILFNKRGNQNVNDSEFNLFMCQRWISMLNKNIISSLNNKVNNIWNITDDKEFWYKYLIAIIPKSKYQRIEYIKKNKEKKKVDLELCENIEMLATNMEISQREVKEYLKMLE